MIERHAPGPADTAGDTGVEGLLAGPAAAGLLAGPAAAGPGGGPRRVVSAWTVAGGLRIHARVPAGQLLAGSPGAGADGQTARPAVVLVHGLVVSSRYMVPSVAHLAPHYRVFAPDMPGFGRSEKPSRVLDLDGLAGALVEWMGAVGLERASLVGNSMGCQVIARVAERYPERLERVVLIGPTIDPAARTTPRQVWRLLVDATREPPGALLIQARDFLDCGPRRTLVTYVHALQDRMERRLPRVAVPALVVRGSRDPLCPQRWAEQATSLLPDGRLVVIPGAGHAVNYNSPAALLRVLRPFLPAAGER